MARACSRSVIFGTPLRSAPTAKMNGLPVIATATMSVRAAAASIASPRLSSPAGPKVLGLVWSWPLSRVIRTALPAP